MGAGSDIKQREKQGGKVSELTFSVPNKAYRETCWCRRGEIYKNHSHITVQYLATHVYM